MGLSTYKQIRFPACPGAYGNVTLVINRPGNESLSQAAADTLLLGEGGEYYPFLVSGDFSLSKKFTTTRGRRALDDLNVAIRDGLAYTGTVDGTPVSEDFTSLYETFFDVWFNEADPYKAFLLYHDNLTGNDEVTHVGWIDPSYAPSTDAIIVSPLTDQQIWLGTRTLKMTAFAQAQLALTWNDVLLTIGESDCQEGIPYNGFMQAPFPGQTNTRTELFAGTAGGTLCLAQGHSQEYRENPSMREVTPPVWPSSPWTSINNINSIAEFTLNSTGVSYAVGDVGTVDGGSTLAEYEVLTISGPGFVDTLRLTNAGAGYTASATPINTTATSGVGFGLQIVVTKVSTGFLWGPSGYTFISLDTLFAKIAAVMGISAPASIASALRFWKQKATTADPFCFVIDTANPIAPEDLYLSLNVFAKCHPHDGSYWDNPVGWSPDTPITDVLGGLCNMLLCDFNIATETDGTQTLVLTPMGAVGNPLSDWTLIGSPSQEEPATGPRVVQVNYKGDDLTIQSPLGLAGDASTIEIPARIHRIGKTSGSDVLPDAEVITFDASLKPEEQANCFREGYTSNDNDHIFIVEPDCWKGLCYLYYYHPSSAHPDCLPADWRRLTGSDDWTNSFFVVNAITRATESDGTTPYVADADLQAQIQGNEYFNLRSYAAVAFASLTLPKPVVQTLTFAGISDSTGSIQAVKAGITKQWRHAGIANQNFVGIQIEQQLLAGETTIQFQQYPDVNGFPNLTDLSFGSVGTGGGTSSTTGSATGGGSSGGGDPQIADSDFPVTTVTLSAASTNNVAALISSSNQTQFVIVQNTHGAAVTVTGIVAPSQNSTILLYNAGSYALTISLNDSASSAANQINGTVFSTVTSVIKAGGSALLAYDTVNAIWQLLNVFPIGLQAGTGITLSQAANGDAIVSASGGSGITSLNGETGAVQTFSETDDTNVTLTITSGADDHNFALGWAGALAVARGGTGANTPAGARSNLAAVESNAPITGATKTKITYDEKGLVTAGADATTADINDSTDRRYVTDNQQTVIADIESLTASRLLGRGSSGAGAPQELTAGDGLSISGTTLSATGGIGSAYSGFFGTGVDGSVTFDGSTTILGMVPAGNVYTMTRDIYCVNITINSGVTVKPTRNRMYATGTITNNGTIQANGNSASGATAGTDPAGAGVLGRGSSGGAGGTSGNGGAGTSFGSIGGGGGGAGGNGSGGTGGPGGSVTNITNANGGQYAYNNFFAALSGHLTGNTSTEAINGGTGGGGGAFGGGNGGGGGAGAKAMLIAAFSIDNSSGTISADGGNGGNAVGTNAGGGGGGGGGWIGMVYHTFTGNAPTANGGTHGTKNGTGVDGNDGNPGHVVQIAI